MEEPRRYIRPGAITSRGLVIENIGDSFVVVPKPYKKSVFDIDINELLDPAEVPNDIALIKHLPFVLRIFAKGYGYGDYWAMTKGREGSPYLLGAKIEKTNPISEEHPIRVSFSKVGQKLSNGRYGATEKYDRIQTFYESPSFHHLEIDEKGLPKLIKGIKGDPHCDLWSNSDRRKFAPLRFGADYPDSGYLWQVATNPHGSLIKTRTVPKEEFYDELIEDYYRLLNPKSGACGWVDFCGNEGIFIKQKELLKYFSINDK